jgi:hypothetical protein
MLLAVGLSARTQHGKYTSDEEIDMLFAIININVVLMTSESIDDDQVVLARGDCFLLLRSSGSK